MTSTTTPDMFCFQCEQTAGCSSCTGARGVCGKTAEIATIQDDLTGALVTLAHAGQAARQNGEAIPTDAVDAMVEGLFATVTNVDFSEASLQKRITAVQTATARVLGGAEAVAPFDMNRLWEADEDIRSLKTLILLGIRGMAAYAYHARLLGYRDQGVDEFFFEGMATLDQEWGINELLPYVLKVGEVNLTCMALLDQANTESYGNPEPTKVTLSVEPGPFIVVSGHDLYDLKLLLDQTQDTGVAVYTHGEMLPAHAYPELKKYSHLKGNFGTAWQSQQKEFADLPAPILFTTNCLMPPRESYADRVFTTEMVAYDGLVHIGDDHDFSPVIEKALELGGYAETQQFTGINGGTEMLTGFGHSTVLSVAETVVSAVKGGDLRHIFLVGGCDGARPGRNYYTDFVANTPEDTVILTLACGKFRFNDLDLGTLGGLPRLMDMGQCNDAYSAIKVAVALAEVFECGVNDLPLSMVLSWYEQKAVCILLTLLHLGIKDIYLGPTLPAFVSPNILSFLVENYNISAISTPEEDMQKMLA